MQLTPDIAPAPVPDALAILAHELRNPIGAIRNAVNLLESRGRTPGTIDQARRLIARQVGQLSVLVEDLLHLPSLSQGGIQLKRAWVDVTSEVDAAIESCAWAIKAAGHVLRVQIPTSPLHAYVDGPRLRQAVTNLLDNACRHTPAFGRIQLSLESVDGFAVLKVEDSGVGIAADLLPRVFNLFEHTACGSVNALRGSGIGLAVVLEIARQHGGEVRASSAGPGCGSTFVMRLPVLWSPSSSQRPANVLPMTSVAARSMASALSHPRFVSGGLAPWQMKRVLDYIKENIARPMLVADIAGVVCLSPSHFNRAFKRSFGLPAHLYVMRRRIEMAQRLMISTSDSLGSIATSCGMCDQSHLTRWFTRVLGETPNDWRRARRTAPVQRATRDDPAGTEARTQM